jgi:hypothetical protein
MRTFIIGGAISWIVLVFAKAPMYSLDMFDWWNWFSRGGWFFFFFLIALTVVFLQRYLSPQVVATQEAGARK